MHDDLKPFKQDLSQKFYKTPKFLKNPKIYQKIPKVRSKHEMNEKVKEIRSYQKKKDQSRPKNPWEWS